MPLPRRGSPTGVPFLLLQCGDPFAFRGNFETLESEQRLLQAGPARCVSNPGSLRIPDCKHVCIDSLAMTHYRSHDLHNARTGTPREVADALSRKWAIESFCRLDADLPSRHESGGTWTLLAAAWR